MNETTVQASCMWNLREDKQFLSLTAVKDIKEFK